MIFKFKMSSFHIVKLCMHWSFVQKVMVVLVLCVCVCVFYKLKKYVIYYLSSFLNKVIYLGLHYVILLFPRLEGLFQVYNDVSDHVLGLFGNNIKLFNFSFREFSFLFFHFQNWLKNKPDFHS
jgi:hypothetical protein